MSLLTCQNLSFSYEGKTVLSDVNFTVNSGDYLCIAGENGAGKSTLIKGILNLKKPSGGSILSGDGLKANEIGYLPQQTQVQKDFPASVYEVVVSGRLNQLGIRPFYSLKDKLVVYRTLKRLGIEELASVSYRKLSGGQQQRVLLARALVSTSRMLLLDEPVTGLDPIMAAEFYKLIWEINRNENITILMVSHDVTCITNYASHVLHLGSSQLFFGTKEEYQRSNTGKRFLAGGNEND